MVMKLARNTTFRSTERHPDPQAARTSCRHDLHANVMLVPGVFQRDWTFEPSTSTRLLGKGGRRQ